jgi:hypothetical protein
MTKPAHVKCGTCAYCEAITVEGVGRTVCRRNPPIHPTVQDDDWCGEWAYCYGETTKRPPR